MDPGSLYMYLKSTVHYINTISYGEATLEITDTKFSTMSYSFEYLSSSFEFWGFHGGADSSPSPLGCDAV